MQKLIVVTTLVAMLAVGNAAAGACSTTLTPTAPNSWANCASCTDTASATATCQQCTAGYQLIQISNTQYNCTQRAFCKSGFYAPSTGTLPILQTCGITAVAGTDQIFTNTPAQTDATTECTGQTKTKDSINYTASVVTGTSGGAPFTATPKNTFACLQCPTNCANCDNNNTDAANLLPASTTTPLTGCKKAVDGYFVGGTLDKNGLGTVCSNTPSAYMASNNATACTACASATNCTAATCPANYQYISLATLPGTTVGGLNLTTLSTVAGPFQGCYNLTFLNATYGPKSASRASVAFAAVIAVVAAVFAF